MANNDDIQIQIRAIVSGLADVRNLVAEIQKLPNAGVGTPGLSNELKSVKAELQSTVAQVQNFSAVTRTALASSVVSAAQLAPVVRGVRAEVRNTGAEFSNTARLASSAGRGIENVFRGNLLAALRNFSIASRTAFKTDGPLAFSQGIQTVSAASQQAQALVAGFSTVLLNAGKNAEVSQQLLKQFGIQSEVALLNPTLAAQKFVAGLAQVESAEDRATIVQNLYGASSAKQLPIIEAQIAAQQQQVAALATLQAAEERYAAAQAAVTVETAAATSTTTGDVIATEGLATAEAEATAATQALATAEAELAAVQGEVAASSGLSAGAIGLIALAAAALIYGLYKLATAQRAVTIVTKDQIDVTARSIELAREELRLAEQLSATTDKERQQREALVAIKKQELETNLNEQKLQEAVAVNSLINALLNEKQGLKDVQAAQDGDCLANGQKTTLFCSPP